MSRGFPGSRTVRLEVATGGRPAEALIRAANTLRIHVGEVWTIGIHLDDDCPAIDAGMLACTFEIVELRGRQAV